MYKEMSRRWSQSKGFTEGAPSVHDAEGRWMCPRAGSKSAEYEAGQGGGGKEAEIEPGERRGEGEPKRGRV